MKEELASALRILIADDSLADRMLLSRIVERQGHTTLLAADGAEAIALFQQQCPDIVLLDALMPNVDGFETARFIKANSADNFVPIIFLTSLSEADELAKCLEVGGDDFLTKPYKPVILQAKLNAFRRMRDMHVVLQQQRDQIAANNQRLIHEQEVAKRTFDKIAHEGALHAENIQYQISPMAVFNGDVLLAGVRPNGNMTMLLGDFTGHGLQAAVGAMPLSETFYSMVGKGFALKEIIYELNRKMKEILAAETFCCATMIDLDFRSKTIEIWSGGMPSNFLYRANSGNFITVPSRHLALGILSPAKFSPNTDVYPMQNGDRFYLWSDGIMESQNTVGEMFGEERLAAIFRANNNADNLFEDINYALECFIGDAERADDLSIAEVKMVDAEVFQEMAPRLTRPLQLNPADWGFSYIIRPVSLRESDPLPLLQKILVDLPGLRPHSGELFTVLSELYSNALEHGVLGLASSLKSTPDGFNGYYLERAKRLDELVEGFIRFEINCKVDHRGMELYLRVIDSGKGFNHESYISKYAGIKSYSGRGLMLINSICRSVEYFNEGNEVQVIFTWPIGTNEIH